MVSTDQSLELDEDKSSSVSSPSFSYSYNFKFLQISIISFIISYDGSKYSTLLLLNLVINIP